MTALGVFPGPVFRRRVRLWLRLPLLNRFLFRGAFLAALLVCANASATMISLATTTLVDRASCIVEGQVTNVSSRWTDDHSAIVTEVVVVTTDVLLGSTNCVTFLYKGGVVGDLQQRVSDMPKVTNGQRVLAFLRPQTADEARRDYARPQGQTRYALVGSAQGLYRIEGGRAKKDGFTVVGDSAIIDRDTDVTALKTRIRERLGASRRDRGGL
jgi:hypothetical protein